MYIINSYEYLSLKKYVCMFNDLLCFYTHLLYIYIIFINFLYIYIYIYIYIIKLQYT